MSGEYTLEEMVDALATPGLLTERQAEAFVRRRIEAEPGYSVAEDMGIDESTVSHYASAAEAKLEAARETIAALDTVRWQAGKPPE